MRCYQIIDAIEKCSLEELKTGKHPYIAVLTKNEWLANKDSFDMGIDIEPDEQEIMTTKAEVNYDSITGTFALPNRDNLESEYNTFAFALDEKGIVFIDDTYSTKEIIEEIEKLKRWREYSLERFIYDFLNQIIVDDQKLLKKYENEMDDMEAAILHDEVDENFPERLNEIRSDIRDLRNHYEQLFDLTEVFEENDNNFFSKENIRYFRLYANRIDRLRDMSTALRDHTIQIRDVYKTHLDVRQNNIMTVLTVVTTIFMPLTLIVGWYGMNFKYMPELDYRISYPIVIAISVLIIFAEIRFFKKRKWL